MIYYLVINPYEFDHVNRRANMKGEITLLQREVDDEKRKRLKVTVQCRNIVMKAFTRNYVMLADCRRNIRERKSVHWSKTSSSKSVGASTNKFTKGETSVASYSNMPFIVFFLSCFFIETVLCLLVLTGERRLWRE